MASDLEYGIIRTNCRGKKSIIKSACYMNEWSASLFTHEGCRRRWNSLIFNEKDTTFRLSTSYKLETVA